MTEANQLRLYKHYVAVGNQANVDMMLKAYPHFANSEEKEEDEKPKSKRKK